MDKIKINIPVEVKRNSVDFLGNQVEIDNYITIDTYEIIANDIRNTILANEEIDNKKLALDIRLNQDILNLCSNIDTEGLEAEELNSDILEYLLRENISNLSTIKGYINSEYELWAMEHCFGIVANKMPSSKDITKSMNAIAKTIEGMDSEKLELIAKSIVWDKMPALGNQIAPAVKE